MHSVTMHAAMHLFILCALFVSFSFGMICSKAYTKLAWRLKYLDFEVTLVNINRLSEIDGFGPSVTKKVRDYLMTKTCLLVGVIF